MSQWKTGQSGNPAGRPKKSECLTDALREAVLDHDGLALKLIAEALVKRARVGNLTAIKLIFDRLEGPPQKHPEAEESLEFRLAASEDPEPCKTGR